MSKVAAYLRRAEEWQRAVEAVLWHDEVGTWLDYDLLNDIKRDYFYPTNVVPLWTNCYDVTKREYHVAKVLKYLEKSQIMLNLGGIPATLEHSGEQWDYPNAWPPLQYFVVMSLDNTDDAWAQRFAYEISERWVRSNFKAFNVTHSMFEKVHDFSSFRTDVLRNSKIHSDSVHSDFIFVGYGTNFVTSKFYSICYNSGIWVLMAYRIGFEVLKLYSVRCNFGIFIFYCNVPKTGTLYSMDHCGMNRVLQCQKNGSTVNCTRKRGVYFNCLLQYDATVSGGGGGGGEYEVQLGFGWSNGLVMDLMNKYGDRLAAEDHFSPTEVVETAAAQQSSGISTAGQMMTGLIAIIISLAAGFIG